VALYVDAWFDVLEYLFDLYLGNKYLCIYIPVWSHSHAGGVPWISFFEVVFDNVLVIAISQEGFGAVGASQIFAISCEKYEGGKATVWF
jgi:hypothetical protein